MLSFLAFAHVRVIAGKNYSAPLVWPASRMCSILARRDRRVEARAMTSKRSMKEVVPKADSESTAKKGRAVREAFARDETPRREYEWDRDRERLLTIVTYNCASLRSLFKPENEKGRNEFKQLIKDVDILCLQETKLQELHHDEMQTQLDELLSPHAFQTLFCSSTAKKGYSGVAVLVRKDSPIIGEASPQEKNTVLELVGDANYGISGNTVSLNEGRVITCRFQHFTLVNVYTPNSGQDLHRLDYRIREWANDFEGHLKSLAEDHGVPVIVAGDLNVAYLDLDMVNPNEKRMLKQAGTTKEERESFARFLETGYTDLFRHFFPDARGVFSYWSMRAGNRPINRGLRLDYFIASQNLLTSETIRPVDCYHLKEELTGSDHGAVVLKLVCKKCA